MPGIGIGISPMLRRSSNQWRTYWTKLLSDIGYEHPMLPGLTIDKVGGVWTITSHTIDDFRKVLASPIVKYVDAIDGLDTNNGNTPATAYKTLEKLRSSGGADRAYLTPGNYAALVTIFNNTTELISSGEAFISSGYLGSELTWTDTGGGVFTAPMTATYVVVDTALTDANGDPTALKSVANAAAVAATAGTFFRDTGTNTLYVRMYDDATPNRASVNVAIAISTFRDSNYNYAENITFVGGSAAASTSTTKSYIAAKNCKFIYKIAGNTLDFAGNVWSWLENCTFARSKWDGANYAASGDYTPYGVEVGCVGRDCGGAENYGINTSIFNGSTVHTGVIILRVNGDYYGTEGIQVHDVGTSVSLNISCKAHDSISVYVSHRGGFGTGAGVGDTSKVYLFDCETSGADTAGVVNRITATAHIYGRLTDKIHSVQAGTTLETF